MQERPEDGLDDWADGLSQLGAMKTDPSQYAVTDDVPLLHEHVQQLRCRWEELCLKVSLRKQEIGDRLNAWRMFKEKNAELCDWLAHMENKTADKSHLNIEEMVEKLKKDCMEEMNLFSENKSHLKQLGEQIIDASNRTKEGDSADAVYGVNDRWQHLFQHIEARVAKLKETLAAMQQLDAYMKDLRTRLADAEARLAQPLVYHVCHADDIRLKLLRQQDVQRNIEEHAATVTTALAACDGLLSDADACGSQSERDAILQTARGLEQRWRNICATSLDRKMRIEETWRLWCKFRDDFARFEDWLKAAELMAANPDSADVLYTGAKEELKRFEAFQRQVHERLTQLELLNKQYRRLARENRTDGAGQLRLQVNQGNRRWDGLQRRVSAVLRRLKHFTSQREDFEGAREGILMWLTEMDLQLTDVEHFSESDAEEKMRQLKAFQHEITLNANKIDALIVFGENLIQKSAPLDAALIEDELKELHSYCQEVFGRVARYHQRLAYRSAMALPEEDPSDKENPPRGGDAVSLWSDPFKKEAARRRVSCQLPVPPLEHFGRETPVSVESLPLEWDHTVDVGGSSSHEDDEDVAFAAVLSVPSASDTPSWHLPASPPRTARSQKVCSASFVQRDYVKLMSECSGSIDDLGRLKSILDGGWKAQVPALVPGLSGCTAHEPAGTDVIERWEVAQAHELQPEADPQRWQKLKAQLHDVISWLDRKLPELEALQRIPPAAGLEDFEDNVRELMESRKALGVHKRVLISLNLTDFPPANDDERPGELKEMLSSANRSWMRACGALERWEAGLRAALTQCQEFHQSLHSLLLWLAQAERRASAAAARQVSPSYSALLEQRRALEVLREELRGRRATAEAGARLLPEAGRDRTEASEIVHAVGTKMNLLLGRVQQCLTALDCDLRTLGPREEEGQEPADGVQRRGHDEGGAPSVGGPSAGGPSAGGPSAGRSLLHRVLRAAFPMHALLMLLLALACSVAPRPPASGCPLANNFARSFYPMLRYTNGPPPT